MARRLAGRLALPILALLGAAANAAPVRGHIKAQQQLLSSPSESLAQALGYAHTSATSIDLRVIGSLSKGHFTFDADYSLQAAAGSEVGLEQALKALEPELFVDRAKTQWLSLDDTLTDKDRTQARQSLDRFSLTYTTESWVFRLGRQAHSWGNGIVFKPFDIFDPFAPDVVDDSYKPGIDAIYTQRLFASGSDVALLVVPRRDAVTGRMSSAASSMALKFRRMGDKLQFDWLVARDYRDAVAGLGITGSTGQAVWRLSVVPVRLDGGASRTSLVANLEHAWQWGDRNVDGFLEYFRNGFGRDDDYALDELAPELTVRLARGQVFNTSRNYVAGGLRIEVTPLVEIDPILLLNLDDGSALALLRGSYSVTQNVSLDFGLRVGIGPSATEFGGLRVSAGSDTFDKPPTRVFARIAYYY